MICSKNCKIHTYLINYCCCMRQYGNQNLKWPYYTHGIPAKFSCNQNHKYFKISLSMIINAFIYK